MGQVELLTQYVEQSFFVDPAFFDNDLPEAHAGFSLQGEHLVNLCLGDQVLFSKDFSYFHKRRQIALGTILHLNVFFKIGYFENILQQRIRMSDRQLATPGHQRILHVKQELQYHSRQAGDPFHNDNQLFYIFRKAFIESCAQ